MIITLKFNVMISSIIIHSLIATPVVLLYKTLWDIKKLHCAKVINCVFYCFAKLSFYTEKLLFISTALVPVLFVSV